MAFVSNLTTTSQGALPARFASVMNTLRARAAQRKVYTQTLTELSLLSNRDLADLGLHRSEIKRVAWQAAYGK